MLSPCYQTSNEKTRALNIGMREAPSAILTKSLPPAVEIAYMLLSYMSGSLCSFPISHISALTEIRSFPLSVNSFNICRNARPAVDGVCSVDTTSI